jgi:predicted short-subunit dehydrogenase-like oxidoreductase (DUF2520 family)
MSAVERAAKRAHPLVAGIVGAGRVGAVVGAALEAAGHRVIATAAVSAASRERAARLLPNAEILPADDVARAAQDLLLLAVPDDALAAVVAGLIATGALREGTVVAHTSGAHGLAVLESGGGKSGPIDGRPIDGRPSGDGLAAREGGGALTAHEGSGMRSGIALHPAMTFTGAEADLDRLPGIAWGVTAHDRAFAARLVTDLGGVPEWIAEDSRPLYHAALAHGANHLVTLVNEAADMLRAAGVEHPERLLAPLLHAALDNALSLGDAALTGPVSRGDAGTVRKHREAMAADFVPVYLALARRTADRAVAAGLLRPVDAALLLDVLAPATVGSTS